MTDQDLLREISELNFGDISLREDQYEHFLRLLKISENNQYYIDMSPTGRGKSYVSLFLAMVMGLKILVFTENSIASTWVNFARKMGILGENEKENPSFIVINYSNVPGRKGKKSDHCCGGLLRREDVIIEIPEEKRKNYRNGELITVKEKTFYHLTDEAEKYFSENTLVIFDEFHNINGGNSLTSYALRVITKFLINGNHRMGFLSATPATKEENFVVFFKIIGVMTFKKLSVGKYIVKLKGLGQILDYCRNLDLDKTNELASKENVNNISCFHIKFCQRVWNAVIKTRFASRMDDFEYRINGLRGHFIMTPEEIINYQRGIRDLSSAVNWTGEGFDQGSWDQRKQIKGLKKIEIAKTGIFYRQIRKSIDQPLRKAVVWVNFLETVDILTELLSDYNPRIIRGDVDGSERDEIIKQFVSPNDECRILIISARCLSTGVSIHFTENNEEGKPYTVDVYISPSFFYIKTAQFIGRFYRVGSVSIPNIWMVYPEEVGYTEDKIISANEVKSELLRKTTSGAGSEVKTLFTSKFPIWVESEN